MKKEVKPKPITPIIIHTNPEPQISKYQGMLKLASAMEQLAIAFSRDVNVDLKIEAGTIKTTASPAIIVK